MRVLIVYATTEGQTGKVVNAMTTNLAGLGHEVFSVDVETASAHERLAAAEAIIIAASIHYERYPPAVVGFVREHKDAIAVLPNLFVSVSLAAAATGDRSTAEAYADRFRTDTGWQPDAIVHVAGAFRFSRYPFWKRLMMRWLARRKGYTLASHGDTELTDWQALRGATEAFVARAETAGAGEAARS